MPGAKAGIRLDGADPINRGLLGFWPAGENGGLSLRDISPYRRNATLTGTTSRNVTQFGRTPRFVRASSLRATAPAIPAVSAITMAVWLIADSAPSGANYGQPFAVGPTAASPLSLNWNHVNLAYRQSWSVYAGGAYPVAKYTSSLVGGKLYFLVATCDGTTLKIYQDGQFVTSVGGATLSPIDGAVQMGGVPNNTAYWDGVAGGFRIWNRALTPAEIMRLYQNKWAGTKPGVRPAPFIFPDLSATINGTVPITAEISAQLDLSATIDATIPVTAEITATLEPNPDVGDTHDGFMRRSRRQRAAEAAEQRRRITLAEEAVALRLELEAAMGMAAEMAEEAPAAAVEAVQTAAKAARVAVPAVPDVEGLAVARQAVAALMAAVEEARQAKALADDDEDVLMLLRAL